VSVGLPFAPRVHRLINNPKAPVRELRGNNTLSLESKSVANVKGEPAQGERMRGRCSVVKLCRVSETRPR
jgi:hypothetical protein